jgi:glutaconyl-CoA/methylmalonyl-CoA decarboxylase subunit gamma
MELMVLCGARAEAVEVESLGNGSFRVRVGAREYSVDSASVSDGTRSLLIEGRQFEVAVRRRDHGEYDVAHGAKQASVTVADPLTFKARVEGRVAGAAGRRRLSAYMPGRVVEVLVEAGARVTAGAGLVVLEAMKMENEIQAEEDCVIHEVLVEAGQAVESGDPLFEVE